MLLGCGHGAAAVFLAGQLAGGQLWLMDTSFIALEMAALTLAANETGNAIIHPAISVLPENAGCFHAAIIDLPKGRKLARRLLCEAFDALAPGGKLFLAGANTAGVQSMIKDAWALFGNSTVLAYKKGNRIAISNKTSNRPQNAKWAQKDGIRPGTWSQVEVHTPQTNLHLASLPGVFSYDRLDQGTKRLLPYIDITPGDKALDLGCGYGVLGILAAQAGAEHVHLLDSNLLAVAAAQKNLKDRCIINASALPSDVLSAIPEARFDKVITNPPFHSGAAVDYQIASAFIYQSYQALNPGGAITLVANKFIRYDRIMSRIFSSTEQLFEDRRFHILRAVRA
jgi:16S rRNA (guanine1207-N2)-methyltransferase